MAFKDGDILFAKDLNDIVKEIEITQSNVIDIREEIAAIYQKIDNIMKEIDKLK